MTIRLPPLPGGNLELVTLGAPDLQPAHGGELALVVAGGDEFRMRHLLAWMSPGGGGRRPAKPEPGKSVYFLRNVAPGNYALQWVNSALPAAGTGFCDAPRPGLTWVPLAPGGSVTLTHDVTRHQKN